MIMILHLIQTSLEKVGLSVSSFTDPLMVLETFRQAPSRYDLVNFKYPNATS